MDLSITLIDRNGTTLEEINIKKPNTYQELLEALKSNLKKMPKHYTIFYYTPNNT